MAERVKGADTIRFGRFELSTDTGELRKDGVRLTLSPDRPYRRRPSGHEDHRFNLRIRKDCTWFHLPGQNVSS
jgi:hypothetical protein